MRINAGERPHPTGERPLSRDSTIPIKNCFRSVGKRAVNKSDLVCDDLSETMQAGDYAHFRLEPQG
ncbi:hypothetical protein C8E87_5822 [Paractinoplanes brasiliensis]|uniref:Uncharacterized protein n=1 Tax=Paractinoplanes brasiliensis TaxID=52695 RepID=A0A4R6JZ47_9ACTN|nr:hypothetical protein C8E87_5822 [Actinoplanes brasiliensis]